MNSAPLSGANERTVFAWHFAMESRPATLGGLQRELSACRRAAHAILVAYQP